MSDLKPLVCPSCGAPLNITGSESEVQCTFCGTRVAVPAEMRKPVASPQGQTAQPTAKPLSRIGCAAVVALFLVIILGEAGFGIIGSQQHPPTSTPRPRVAPTATTFNFGGEGTDPGLFTQASRLAVDIDGNVYVIDSKTTTIQKFDANGKYLATWQVPHINKYGPQCVASDWSGGIYACQNGSVLKFDSAGNVIARFPADRNTNEFLAEAAINTDGTVLAFSEMAGQDDLVKFSPDGKEIGRWPKFISTLTDDPVSTLRLAVDGRGNLFVIDNYSEYVFKFGPDGKYINRFGGKGKQPGEFQGFNNAIALDSQSNVYVEDFSGIVEFDSDGHYLKTLHPPAAGLSDFVIAKNQMYMVIDNKIYRMVLGG